MFPATELQHLQTILTRMSRVTGSAVQSSTEQCRAVVQTVSSWSFTADLPTWAAVF